MLQVVSGKVVQSQVSRKPARFSNRMSLEMNSCWCCMRDGLTQIPTLRSLWFLPVVFLLKFLCFEVIPDPHLQTTKTCFPCYYYERMVTIFRSDLTWTNVTR